MPDPITTPLFELAPDTLVAQPVTTDEWGDWVSSGQALNLRCRISGKTRMVRDPVSGREVVSSLRATVMSTPGLHLDKDNAGFRFTLPSDRPAPRTNLKALDIKHVSDENGPHHEVVIFP